MKEVMILTGAGQIGMAIARRMGYGMKIVIGDKKLENAESISKTMNEAGFDTVPVEMDLASRESIMKLIEKAQSFGEASMLVNAAGVSPCGPPATARAANRRFPCATAAKSAVRSAQFVGP